MPAHASPWIASRATDIAMVVIPFIAGTIALFLVTAFQIEEPLWVYMLAFVAFDVAHVWATAYLTYLDKKRFSRRRALYTWPIPIGFLAAFILHVSSPTAYWTLLSYFAIFHFAKQQYGFVAIYKALHRERSRLDYWLDKTTLWVGALGPVLLWHAAPHGQFEWFGSGEDFLIRLPPAWSSALQMGMILVAVTWSVRQVWLWRTAGHWNPGKTMWMVASWASWLLGVKYSQHLLVSAAYINFIHGLPFLILVYRRLASQRGTTALEGAPLVAWLSAPGRGWAFYAFVFGIGLIEEIFWDGMVWQTYMPTLFTFAPAPTTGWQLSFWIALLSTPQIVHYFLDGFLWKMNAHNDDLMRTFGVRSQGQKA